jgi:hypothetical protein
MPSVSRAMNATRAGGAMLDSRGFGQRAVCVVEIALKVCVSLSFAGADVV